jgi:DNA gyrase subunit B
VPYSERGFMQPERPSLTPREAVRLRPGMYVGGTDTNALHHLIYMVMDHFVEEALLRRCTHIYLTLQNDGKISVFGNTFGLPVDQYRDTSETKLEAMLNGFVSKKEFEPDLYDITGGLHGIGLAVINMLCGEMIVENGRDGVLWRKVYYEGIPQGPLERIGEALPEQQGTRFTFKPDPTIFDNVEFKRQMLLKRCKEVAYQISSLQINFSDQRNGDSFEQSFFAADGLKTMILDLNEGEIALHEPIHVNKEIEIPVDVQAQIEVGIEFAFQFTTGKWARIFSFANSVPTRDGGVHLYAFQAAIVSVLNSQLDSEYKPGKPIKYFSWSEIEQGLSAAITVRHAEPRFESPTKERLDNKEIYGPIAGLVFDAFYPQWTVVEDITEHFLKRRKQSQNKRSND